MDFGKICLVIVCLCRRINLSRLYKGDASFQEGFARGIPTILFSDLDIVKDIHDNELVYQIKSRNTVKLKEGMISAINKKWDDDYIKTQGQPIHLKL